MKKIKLKKLLLKYLPIIILIIISLVNMYLIKDSFKYYFLKQTTWFILGFIIILIIHYINPNIIYKYSKYLYYFNILLLILVLIFGKNINGSRAWFNFGIISFQPSELMKFSLALYLSNILSNTKGELKIIFESLIITLIPSILVFLEPDTGAIVIYILIMIGVIIPSKISKKWYIIIGSFAILFLGLFFYLYYFKQDLLISLIGTSFFYRIDRLLSFVNKSSFQLERSLIAIGTSGIISKGNHIYIPEAPTDFIVALSISNLGLISFIIIVLCFLSLDLYYIYQALNIKDLKVKMFYTSFILMFIFAQIENIGMNLGLLPIMGIPLPFLSYGGTNIIVYFIFLGVLDIIKK